MNVLITNKQETLLAGLSVEIIKTLRGEYEVDEIIGNLSNFFFGRMILDLTAIKNYENIANIQKLSIGMPVEKIILLLPQDGNFSTNSYLSKLISMGFYNFTTNLEGVEYLINNPNSYKDVAHLHQLEPVMAAVPVEQSNNVTAAPTTQQFNNQPQNVRQVRIIGFKNCTDEAGATTLVVTLKKELENFHGKSVKAIEVGKRDFVYFNDRSLVSVNKVELLTELSNSYNYDLVLVDLNDMDDSVCGEVYYLIEPSIIKINKIAKRDRNVFEKLRSKNIIINKSMISNDEISDFANETNLKIFTAIRPFNDRSRGQVLSGLINRLGIVQTNFSASNGNGYGGSF